MNPQELINPIEWDIQEEILVDESMILMTLGHLDECIEKMPYTNQCICDSKISQK